MTTVETDRRPWVREYVTVGAVQGDFRQPSAVAVVERAQHPRVPDAVAYEVRLVEELPAEAAIRDVAAYAAHVTEVYEAARCVLDATTAGAPILRVWDERVKLPRCFHPVHLTDRERPELTHSDRFELPRAKRLDLLGAIRVALDIPGGLVWHPASVIGKDAMEEYVAKQPTVKPEEEEWVPPPTWHLVLAVALGVWNLMESPKDLQDGGVFGTLDYAWQRRFRFDRNKLRDMTEADRRRQSEEAPPLPTGRPGFTIEGA